MKVYVDQNEKQFICDVSLMNFNDRDESFIKDNFDNSLFDIISERCGYDFAKDLFEEIEGLMNYAKYLEVDETEDGVL